MTKSIIVNVDMVKVVYFLKKFKSFYMFFCLFVFYFFLFKSFYMLIGHSLFVFYFFPLYLKNVCFLPNIIIETYNHRP